MSIHINNLADGLGRVREVLPYCLVKSRLQTIILAGSLLCGEAFAAISDGVSKQVQLNPVVGSGDVAQIGLGLVVVITMIFGGAWLMRRFGNLPGRQNNLQVLGGISLGSRERVVILRAGDTQMLVGVSPGCVTTLHVFDEPIVNIDDRSENATFGERLLHAHKQQSESKKDA